MLDDWGVHSPHEFQLCNIHHIAFQHDQLLYIIAKTGLGKSAIPLTIGLLQTRVTLSVVPLVGLGSDEVNKSSNDDNLIETDHLDKHRGIDGKVLRDCLLSLNEQEANHVSIFLYASPQSLQVGTFWCQCLLTLSSRNMIWLIVIDEAHTVAKDGCSF
jgi:superfamily II DNA helicase RecQ